MGSPTGSEAEGDQVGRIARQWDLRAHRRPSAEPITVDLPFGSFDPWRTLRVSGRVGLSAELLRLRGLITPVDEPGSARAVLAVFRSREVIERMTPRQDRFLRPYPEEALLPENRPTDLDLIAAENQANWFAHLVEGTNQSTSVDDADLVRLYNPETGVVFGDLPLDDLLVRLAVQELVWAMKPRLWERRHLVGSTIPAELRATEATSMVTRVDGQFPGDVAVGPDWIVTYGGYPLDSVYLLRYQRPHADFDTRFEQARAVLGGDWGGPSAG